MITYKNCQRHASNQDLQTGKRHRQKQKPNKHNSEINFGKTKFSLWSTARVLDLRHAPLRHNLWFKPLANLPSERKTIIIAFYWTLRFPAMTCNDLKNYQNPLGTTLRLRLISIEFSAPDFPPKYYKTAARADCVSPIANYIGMREITEYKTIPLYVTESQDVLSL